MAEILSGTSTRGLTQRFISKTSASININDSGVPFYAFSSGSIKDNDFKSNHQTKPILPIPIQNETPATISAYYLMRAYKESIGYIYWEATGGIDTTAQESGVNPALLTFITFLGSRAV